MTMELEFERETMTYYETAASVTLCQEETLESIVPDACPDILRIVDVCGQGMLTGTQARDGVASVSGLVRAWILYQPESGRGLRRMEVSIPFSCQAEAPGLTPQGKVLASPRLRCAEARALNPRKVLLRVDLAVDVTACQPVDRPLCRGILEGEKYGVCQKQFTGETSQITAVEEKPFSFSQEVRLQTASGEPPQLLAARAQALCGECRLIGSKLVLKGTVELALLLEEAEGAVTASRQSMPFSQILEVPASGEERDCQVRVEVTQLECQPSIGDGAMLEVDLELLAQAVVRGRRPVAILQDLYSTQWLTELQAEPQSLSCPVDQGSLAQPVRELLESQELARSVVDSRLAPGQVVQSREGEQLVLTCDVWAAVLYQDGEGQLQNVRRTIPVSVRLDCPASQRCSCSCTAGELFAAPAAGGIEVRFTVEFQYRTAETRTVPMVTSARLGEARSAGEGQRPSVVLRAAAPGEGLWELAKAYGTTREEILQANGLESEQLPAGRLLLIPSTR